VLVGLHLLGSAAVAAGLAWLLVGVRDRAADSALAEPAVVSR